MDKCWWIVWASLIWATASEAEGTHGSTIRQVAFALGDDAAWADPRFDDSDWPRENWYDLRFFRQNLWVRTRVILSQKKRADPMGLFIAGMFSAEVFWDGELIGRKGVPGSDRLTETPGPMDRVIWLHPEKLKAGEHLLALRLSNHHLQVPVGTPFHGLIARPYREPLTGRLRHYLPALTTLGGLLLAALYFLGRFWKERKSRGPLWLALTCVAVLGQLTAESARGVWGYSYDWHMWRMFALLSFSWLFGICLVAYLGSRLAVPHSRKALIGGSCLTLLIVLAPVGYDLKTLLILLLFLLIALMLTLWGYRHRRPTAGWSILGIVFFSLLLLVTTQMFLDRYLFVGFWGLLVTLFYGEVEELNREKEARRKAELARQRLELELLKKHLQPHFLMNTLNSLAEWFEENPSKGSGLIERLAEETRLLYEIADRRTIPAAKEIALCRAHLDIMGGRMDRAYHLETEGLDLEAEVPPAVFHTLVENAVTHNAYHASKVVFHLEQTAANGASREYIFTSPPGDQPSQGVAKEGAGSAYIRARLREAFGEAWRLEAGPTRVGGWQTHIRIG